MIDACAQRVDLSQRREAGTLPLPIGIAISPEVGTEALLACERGDIWLAFQPIVDRHDSIAGWQGKVHGAEVLLRWNHPVLGALPPASFIPMLEKSGLIHPVGEWVLREACFQVRQWLDDGLDLRQFSVNVSPSQIHDPGFSDKVRRALADSGLNPVTLALEVTENILLDNTEQTISGLLSLTSLGVGLHIDDFGTGFSSIAYLKRLPLTAVKVDRSFLSDIENNPRDRELVRWMIQLGNIFGLETIAEGVESASVGQLMLDMGSTRLQGFLYGAGVRAGEFERLHLRQPRSLS